jgi:4-hydroxy-tetrahydrodipicolinate synthase
VGAATTERAARLAEHAARAGIESICCVPPFFYGRGDEEIVEHYRIVAAAADLPLFIYNLPSATGVEITPQLAGKIQDRVPQLTGLKHSAANFYNIRAFDRMGLACFTGSGALFLPALTIGAAGCVDGPPCLAPELWVAVWDAYRARDLDRAEEAQARASEVEDMVIDLGYLGALKAAVGERLGIETGKPRLPTPSATPEQEAQAREAVHRLGIARIPKAATAAGVSGQ